MAVKMETDSRLALLIGNDAYDSKALQNAAQDAEDMSKTLHDLGFKTTTLKNASRQKMISAIRQFGSGLRKKGGVGFFFFAGHGVQVRGRNYLIPVNTVIETESDVEFEAVDAGRILGKMQDAGNDVNILVLDACRDNPYSSGFRSLGSGLAQVDAPKGSFIAYATAPGKVAIDGEGDNGVFTTYLLEHMRTPNLTIEQVMNRTRQDVARATSDRQIPWHSSSLIGDFILFEAHGVQNKPGDVWTDKITGMRFVWVPKGCFLMGQTPEEEQQLVASLGLDTDLSRFADEHPQKKVCVDGFWMAAHEVTNAQFRQFKKDHHSGNFNGIPLNDESMPVSGVSWVGAIEYADWLNRQYQAEKTSDKAASPVVVSTLTSVKNRQDQQFKGEKLSFRLPTEAEWEYACRAKQYASKFWLKTKEICRYANVNDQISDRYNRFQWHHYACNDGFVVSSPVGSYKMNPFGLYDMIGNTWEWTDNMYRSYDKENLTGISFEKDFAGHRVIRGGSWLNGPSNSRCAIRGAVPQDRRNMDLGFRLIREP